MRILALADIHGAYDAMDAILKKEPSVDVIVIAGDLTTNGSAREAGEAIRRVQEKGKPILAVAGNMDPSPIDEIFATLGVSINGRGRIVGDVGFFGISAAPISFLRTPNEITEDEITRRAELGWREVARAKWKILVPHSPPAQTKVDKVFIGKHVGSPAVRSLVERYQPDVTICGHIHEARGQDTIGKSRIINCGTAAKGFYGIIEVTDEIAVENRP